MLQTIQSPILAFKPPIPSTPLNTNPKRTIIPSHIQTHSSPLAHITKEVRNKKTKEQEDQGQKMTRGSKKKGTMLFGKQEERNKMTTRRKAHVSNHPVPNSSF